MTVLSRTQVDRLGDRFRSGEVDEDDLRLLDDYRQSFTEAYQEVVAAVRGFGLSSTGRPLKTTASISDKLLRESIRLSQVQDIAGCRVIVGNLLEQDVTVSRITAEFEKSMVFDRRSKPSNGYRAVHVVVHIKGKPVEVQVRTPWQHAWAELSEKLSDVVDPAIKYGGGPEEARTLLMNAADLATRLETDERTIMVQGDAATAEEIAARTAFFEQKQRFGTMLDEFVQSWRND